MSNAIYNTDFKSLGRLVIKPVLRATNVGKLVDGFLKPLNSINAGFSGFRESAVYKVSHDSRKLSIEKVLNDSFDSAQRRIYIDNVTPRESVHLYEPGDDRPVHIYDPADDQPVYLYEQLGDLINTVNFIVLLPNAIKPSDAAELFKLETKINANIDFYKLYSKNHTLLWID